MKAIIAPVVVGIICYIVGYVAGLANTLDCNDCAMHGESEE